MSQAPSKPRDPAARSNAAVSSVEGADAALASSRRELAHERREYHAAPLTEADAPHDPFQLFHHWLASARLACKTDPTAMALSTVHRGQPQVRTVLLKDWSPDGFVFYTRLQSRKASALAQEPRCALLFHWRELERQVHVEGVAARVSDEEADEYFRSRPRASQLTAHAAGGEQRLRDREELHRRYQEERSRWDGHTVERPATWGGFRVSPRRIEFWQGQPSRLHDRLCYELSGTAWERFRLAP